jgi:hypothetical protein
MLHPLIVKRGRRYLTVSGLWLPYREAEKVGFRLVSASDIDSGAFAPGGKWHGCKLALLRTNRHSLKHKKSRV